MPPLKSRVVCHYISLGYKAQLEVSTGPVRKAEYVNLANQPGIDAYHMDDYILWVDHSNKDESAFPETVLVHVPERRKGAPTVEFVYKHITEISPTLDVEDTIEEAISDHFGHQIFQTGDVDLGVADNAPALLYSMVRHDELIHSMFLITGRRKYLRINYIDGGYLMFIVPNDSKAARVLWG